jgi:hypothetical protein
MAERLTASRYSATQFAFPHESLLDGLERLTRLIASLGAKPRPEETARFIGVYA